MISQLLIGTTNPGKFKEISEVLSTLPIELLTPQGLGIQGQPEETGINYEENARIKCQFYYDQSKGLATLAEDSGIEVDAFPGELGLTTRRWGAGPQASDEEWLRHFLAELAKHPQELHRATFVCTAALQLSGEATPHIFRGTCPGRILLQPQTAIPHGIPLSACFVADGQTKVYNALDPIEKNKISHRGWAIHQVREFFIQNQATQSDL